MLEQGIDSVLALMDEDFKSLIRKTNDSHVLWHHGFGTRVRNVLNLWNDESSIVKWFKNQYGLFHADDISGVLVNGAFHKIRNKPFDPQVQIDRYLEHWSTAP